MICNQLAHSLNRRKKAVVFTSAVTEWSHRLDSTAYRHSVVWVGGVSVRFPEQRTRNESQSHFLAFVPFLVRQNRKSRPSVFLCSETKRRRLLRWLLLTKNHLLKAWYQEYKMCSCHFLTSELLTYFIRANSNWTFETHEVSPVSMIMQVDAIGCQLQVAKWTFYVSCRYDQ